MKKLLGAIMAIALGVTFVPVATEPAAAQNKPQFRGGKSVVVVPRLAYRSGPYRSYGGGYARSNRGRNVAIGVGAAIVGGVIANEVYRSSGGYSCAALERRCDDGQEWACRRLDNNNC